MKIIKYSIAILLLLGAIAQEEVSAIRMNEAKDEAEDKSSEEKGADELASSTKKAGAAGPKSPYCAVEGKECKEREGYKASEE
jgi:hypothetical protein